MSVIGRSAELLGVIAGTNGLIVGVIGGVFAGVIVGCIVVIVC